MASDRKRLWVDGQCLQTASRMRGIGRYVQELLIEIIENFPRFDVHVSLNAAMPEEAMAARDFLQNWLPTENIHAWHGVAEGGEAMHGYTDRRRLSEIALAYHVARLAPDLALSASPFEGALDCAVPLVPNNILRAPIAAIFYDAIAFRFPQHYLAEDRMRAYYTRRLETYRAYDVNLCISDFCKRELTDILGLENGVDIGAGVSKNFLALLNDQPERAIEDNSLLYVGGFDWRKNVPRVIAAINALGADLRLQVKFIVVGDLNYLSELELRKQWSQLGLPPEHLRLVGHVSDRELVARYRQVAAVIQPSLMEGFGLTALEAILCGAQVVASNAGALPEIVIDKANLFDAVDVLDIARHIEQALLQSGSSTVAARRHAEKFTWNRSVRIAEDAFERILDRDPRTEIEPVDRLESRVAHAVRSLTVAGTMAIDCLSLAEPRALGQPRLIVDATSTVTTGGRTGIQRVVTKICANLVANAPAERRVVIAFSDSDTEWFEVPGGRLETGPEQVRDCGGRILFAKNDHVLMLDSSWTLHAEHKRTLTGARIRGAQVTSCLYDTVPLRASGFTHSGMPPVFSAWFRSALTYSTGFVCISRTVCDELIALLRAINFPRPMKIGYWPLGADFAAAPAIAHKPANNPAGGRAFLMVGTIEPRKGHRVALDAFESLWRQGVDVQLTIVGRLGWGSDHIVARIQNSPEFHKRLHWDGDASDDALEAYYASADCLIAASFAEGFGLPIVEAGHFGKPIIASDIEVFREVSIRSAQCTFFAPGDGASLAKAIEEFVTGKDQPGDHAAAGAWDTWEESASKLQDLLRDGPWYHTYLPEDGRMLTNCNDIGQTVMNAPLAQPGRADVLHLLEGPMPAEGANAVKFIVAVENQSPAPWISADTDGGPGVYLAARLFDRGGRLVKTGPIARIPFVLIPGDTIYLPIELPTAWSRQYRDAEVHIELVQQGGPRLGNPLVIEAAQLKKRW